MSRYLMLLCLPLFVLLACGSGSGADAGAGEDEEASKARGTTVLYFTRHAEKAGGQDPDLLPAGRERAERIAAKLRNKGITAVYATGFQRTQQTAAPLAKALGLEVQTYRSSANDATVTDEWLSKHRGETVFVVGHSNTVPDLLNTLLGERRYSDIDEGTYDRLFRVSVRKNGKARVREMSSN